MKLTKEDLEKIFRLKYRDLSRVGWGPRMRLWFGYFTPDDLYEAIVEKLVDKGCAWLDVGSGRNIFPSNRPLAKILADRCGILVGVDPSDNLDENPFVHERRKSTIEKCHSERVFDVVTLRMVVEHITTPKLAVDALSRLIRPGGKVVVYTVNWWTPGSLLSWVVPFWAHHFIKWLFWSSEEKDTFPVVYQMNTRTRLSALFNHSGFKESDFVYLDDCRTLGSFRLLSFLELSLWRLLKALGLRYPENCLLGIYERL